MLLVSLVALLAVLSGDGDGSRAAAEKCGGGGAFRASGGAAASADGCGAVLSAHAEGKAGPGSRDFRQRGADVENPGVTSSVVSAGPACQGEGRRGRAAACCCLLGFGPFSFLSFFLFCVLFFLIIFFKPYLLFNWSN